MTEHSFSAIYYDGVDARAHDVRVAVADGRLTISGAVEREFDLRAARVSEPLARAPRLITFVDGSHLEVADHAQLDRVLAATGFRDSWVVRWQRHWPAALGALLMTIAVVGFGYAYGLPAFARVAASWVPPQIEARIGAESVDWLDRHLLAPTALPTPQRERLLERFAQLAPRDARAYRVEFRAGKIGPNAFALPGGRIVVTDDLAILAGSDDAILGVLAHELGHVQQRHLLRRLISSAVVGAAITLLVGDASGILTALPATLADLTYSRDMEREADRYAIELLLAHGVPLEPLAQLLEAMESAQRFRSENKSAKKNRDASRAERGDEPVRAESSAPDWTRYLSTHPVTADRVRDIRAAAASR